MLLTVRALEKSYAGAEGRVPVLRGIDMEVAAGETLALTGESGSGKSTLLHLIGGLDSPTSGSVEVAGARLETLNSGQLAHWRAANVGFIFQFYNLLPMLSARSNVELPLLLTSLSAREREQRGETTNCSGNSAHSLADRASVGGTARGLLGLRN